MAVGPHSDPTSEKQDGSLFAAQLRNLLIVLVAIVLSASIFFGLRTQTPTGALTALAESAVPLEVALTNGKPTLMEFYANWCTVCQAMAADVGTLKTQYEDRVNFVMLNVDNTKWLPEMLHYQVDGIPHFVFLDAHARSIASTIGEQPYTVMADNLEALIAALPLPHIQASGQASSVEPALTSSPRADSPRSHGTQTAPQ
jgi:thiol-disulfide isomerase/thioredoxin